MIKHDIAQNQHLSRSRCFEDMTQPGPGKSSLALKLRAEAWILGQSWPQTVSLVSLARLATAAF
jgi:hypothetical protein